MLFVVFSGGYSVCATTTKSSEVRNRGFHITVPLATVSVNDDIAKLSFMNLVFILSCEMRLLVFFYYHFLGFISLFSFGSKTDLSGYLLW